MASEQDLLEKAKQKLSDMNKRAQKARNMSKNRPGPRASEADLQAPVPAPVSNTYLFELTESMLADRFSEDDVVRYVAWVESDSKLSDLELDQRELSVQAELKRINLAIKRIKEPRAAKEGEDGSQGHDGDPASPGPAGYAGIHQARQNPAVAKKKLSPGAAKKPAKVKPEKPEWVGPGDGEIKATGAGAKFLEDLGQSDD
jgi:hypothetical protein